MNLELPDRAPDFRAVVKSSGFAHLVWVPEGILYEPFYDLVRYYSFNIFEIVATNKGLVKSQDGTFLTSEVQDAYLVWLAAKLSKIILEVFSDY